VAERLGGAAAQQTEKPASSEPELVVGIVGHGELGDAVRDGATFAVETLNRDGGILGRSVRLRVETLMPSDKEVEVRARAVKVASRLLREPNLTAVIGHSTMADALPAAIAYHRRDILFFAPTISTSDLSRHGLANVFATIPDTTDIATQTARLASDIGLRRVVVLRDRSAEALELSLAYRDEAAVLGITVVNERSFRLETANPRDVLAGLQGLRIDHLLIATPLDFAVQLVRQAGAMGLSVTSVLPQFADAEALRPQLAKVNGRILMPVLRNRTGPTPTQAAWAAAYEMRFGTAPSDWAMQGADAMGLLAAAAARSGSVNREELISLMRLEIAHIGIAGRFSFRRNGRLYTRLLTFASVRPDEVIYYMPGA
jgi:branched-chain amino acid transport system substrate-binding protein